MDRGLIAPVHFEQLMKLDEWTPDGRLIESAGFGTRNLPRPIYFMDEQGPGGHMGAKVAGRLDSVIVEEGVVSGDGWLIDNEAGRNCALCLDTKAVHGNSVDLADVQAEVVLRDVDGQEDYGVKFTRANVGATTVLGIPAFPDATAGLDGLQRVEGARTVGAFADTTFAVQSPAAPKLHTTDVPLDWFIGEQARKPYPLTVEANGRVHGYLADWQTTHLTATGRVKAPKGSGYRYFNASTVLTPEGPAATGPLTIGGDHARTDVSWTEARDHYAATSLAWADVHATDDRHGIRLNGMVRPGTPAEAVHAGRASRLSGDWRKISNKMELIASLSVNAPAFPVAREFASANGEGSIVLFAPTAFAQEVGDAELLAARNRLALARLRLASVEV